MLLSATSQNTTMLSGRKFDERCKQLNCDPRFGITFEALNLLYSTLDPEYLSQDYDTIFSNSNNQANTTSHTNNNHNYQGWTSPPHNNVKQNNNVPDQSNNLNIKITPSNVHNHQNQHLSVSAPTFSNLERVTCGTDNCNGMIAVDPNARFNRCRFCIQYNGNAKGYANCPICNYSLCQSCFDEMVEFKKSLHR
eukprot:UN28555